MKNWIKTVFIDPYEGGLRGRWYLLLAAVIWIGGNYYIWHVLARPH
jgi:uncharacterized membrane protein